MLPELTRNSMVSTDLWKPIRTRWLTAMHRWFCHRIPNFSATLALPHLGENKTDAFALNLDMRFNPAPEPH